MEYPHQQKQYSNQSALGEIISQMQAKDRSEEICKQCTTKQCLINKYVKLIKLLKVKIYNLQTEIKNKDIQFQVYCSELKSKTQIKSYMKKTKQRSFLYQNIKQNISQNLLNKSNTIQQSDKLSKLDLNNCKKMSGLNNRQIQVKIQNIFKIKQDNGQSFGIKNLLQQFKESMISSTSLQKSSKRVQHQNNLQQRVKPISDNMKMHSFKQIFLKNQQELFELRQNEIQGQKQRAYYYQQRIERLSQNILDIKSLFMHVRQTIYNFVRSLNIQFLQNHSKKAEFSNTFYMLSVIMNIFEYSQLQRQQMIQKRKKKLRKKHPNLQIGKSIKNIFITLKNL